MTPEQRSALGEEGRGGKCESAEPKGKEAEGGMMRMRVSSQPIGRPKSIQPAACFQSSRTRLRCCQTCGELPDVINIPTRHIGYFCGQCCPACREKPEAEE
jgi:hypothetical protein